MLLVSCNQTFVSSSAQPDFSAMLKSKKRVTREARRARYLPALINIQGQRSIECRLLDISQGGAKLSAAMPSAIPDRFDLAFAESAQARSCRVVWRRGKLLGVRFTTTSVPSK
jgi:ribosomal protein L39E